MMPNQKNIMTRYSFIILMMVLIGIAIFCERKRNRSPNPRKHYLF